MRVEAVYEAVRPLMAELPEQIRDELRGVRVAVLPAPTPELIEEGCELGEGGAYIVRGEEEMPLGDELTDEKPQRVIYLFAQNIADAAKAREVFLHELAHACGLDEEEVAEMMEAVTA